MITIMWWSSIMITIMWWSSRICSLTIPVRYARTRFSHDLCLHLFTDAARTQKWMILQLVSQRAQMTSWVRCDPTDLISVQTWLSSFGVQCRGGLNNSKQGWIWDYPNPHRLSMILASILLIFNADRRPTCNIQYLVALSLTVRSAAFICNCRLLRHRDSLCRCCNSTWLLWLQECDLADIPPLASRYECPSKVDLRCAILSAHQHMVNPRP